MIQNYVFHLLVKKQTAFLMLMALSSLLAGCSDQCEGNYTYKIYEPVYLSRTDLIQTVKSGPAKPLAKTGKIYAFGSYILVNEQHEGIHVIDNSNPKAPQNISFISIPGNIDMAIRNNILYADAATDLLALDFANPASVKILKHLENVFETPLIFNSTSTGYLAVPDTTKGLVIDYKERLITEQRNCDEIPGANNNRPGGDLVFFDSNYAVKSSPTGPTGTGGSMARFTIAGNYLYTVGTYKMDVFNLASPANPQKGESVYLGSGIETIFPYQNKLFIGSNAGMFIYSISNPAVPALLGGYSHLRACDPVVVEGNYAYVTLRTNESGSWCGPTNANQLDVVDISNPQAPKVRKTYPMQNPHGLGIDNGTLFVCEGNYGLKVFKATNPDNITDNKLAHLKNLKAFDVIPLGKNLLVIGEDGFRQYDYSDPKNVTFLSMIPVVKKE